MATESFDRKFIIKHKEAVDRFYQALIDHDEKKQNKGKKVIDKMFVENVGWISHQDGKITEKEDQMNRFKFRILDDDTGEYVYSDQVSEEYVWGFEEGKIVCYFCYTEYPSDQMEAPYPSSREVDGHIELVELVQSSGI